MNINTLQCVLAYAAVSQKSVSFFAKCHQKLFSDFHLHVLKGEKRNMDVYNNETYSVWCIDWRKGNDI